MDPYKISRGQLYSLWFFSIIGWTLALIDSSSYGGSTFSSYMLVLIPAIITFYTIGWRNKNGPLIPALKKLLSLSTWCLNKIKRFKFKTKEKQIPTNNKNKKTVNKLFETKAKKSAKTMKVIAFLTILYFISKLVYALSLTEYNFKFNPETIGFFIGFGYGLFGIQVITILLGFCILAISNSITKKSNNIIPKTNLMFLLQIGIITTLSTSLASNSNLIFLLGLVLTHFIFYSIPAILTKKTH